MDGESGEEKDKLVMDLVATAAGNSPYLCIYTKFHVSTKCVNVAWPESIVSAEVLFR